MPLCNCPCFSDLACVFNTRQGNKSLWPRFLFFAPSLALRRHLQLGEEEVPIEPLRNVAPCPKWKTFFPASPSRGGRGRRGRSEDGKSLSQVPPRLRSRLRRGRAQLLGAPGMDAEQGEVGRGDEVPVRLSSDELCHFCPVATIASPRPAEFLWRD